MMATNLRYYSFVSRFVGTVSNEPLHTELSRSLRARRLFEKAHLQLADATGTVANRPESRKAA